LPFDLIGGPRLSGLGPGGGGGAVREVPLPLGTICGEGPGGGGGGLRPGPGFGAPLRLTGGRGVDELLPLGYTLFTPL